MSNIKWHGEQFTTALEVEQRKRVARAAMVVEREAKRLLSVSGTGWQKKIRGTVTQKKRGGRGKGWTVYGAFPSKPGEPPHKQSGQLRMGVTHEPGPGTSQRVGPARGTPWGKWTELGTRFMRPRPWLVRSLNDMAAQVKAILTAPWKSS